MIIKQCVKLKGKPSSERKKQVGEHTRNMAHCTKERKTLNWLLHLHCEKCHFIRTSVSVLPRSILINYFNLNGPISILTLFYAPLKYRILNDRALQQNKNTFFIMKVKLSNQHSHFPCTEGHGSWVCSPTCFFLSELDSLFNPTFDFLSPAYHTAC